MEDNPFFDEPGPVGNEETMEVSRHALDQEIAMAKKELLSDLVDKNKKQSDPLERLKNIVSQYKQSPPETKEPFDPKLNPLHPLNPLNPSRPYSPFPGMGSSPLPPPPQVTGHSSLNPPHTLKPFTPSSSLPITTPPPNSPFPPFDYKNKNTPPH